MNRVIGWLFLIAGLLGQLAQASSHPLPQSDQALTGVFLMRSASTLR